MGTNHLDGSRTPGRADLYAALQPKAARTWAWVLGALTVGLCVRAIASIASGSVLFGLVAIASVVVSAGMALLALRSMRRLPETRRWIGEHHPEAPTQPGRS